MEGFERRLVRVRVKDFSDLARLAASGIMMGQPTYIIRFTVENGSCVYGVMAVFKDFYRYYGVPLMYYWVDEGCKLPLDRNYVAVRSDELGEHVEFSKGFRPGSVNIPIINLKEVPDFVWGTS
jgi:hypothetical protein